MISFASFRFRPPYLAFALALGACGGGGDGAGSHEVAADERVPEPVAPTAPESDFDEDGKLRASDRQLAGLTLPRGLGEPQSGSNRHIFRTSVAPEKLVEYFGPRLFTGNVDRHGEGGASFLNARPIESPRERMRVDVNILAATPRETHVIIRVIPPPPPRPATTEEIQRFHDRLD